MKRAALLALLSLAAYAASAGQRSDYSQEWPLRLARADGGAFRVVLSEAIYRAAQDRDLADIEVFNAAGESLPAALLGPEGASAQEWPRELLDLPWFLLPPLRPGEVDSDWNLRTERDAQGRVLRVEASVTPAAAAEPARELLLDLSQVQIPLAALRLVWADDVPAFRTSVTLSASDDLQHWNTLGNGVIADLRNGPLRMRRDQLEIGRERGFRYLRVTATTSALPPLQAVRAETAPPPPEPEWRWLSLVAEQRQEGERVYYVYRTGARIPAQQLDVKIGGSNSVATWTVRSRDIDTRPWTSRAGPWTGYRVATGDAVESSIPQHLNATTRDREWRVDAAPTPNTPPSLVLGYRPEVLVFLAQGEGPYSIAAGSAKTQRRDAPITALLDALRRRHGADWNPYPAIPESSRTISGEAALVPPPKQREPDWRNVLLWFVLVAATLLVVAMALRLLKSEDS
ncbi:MAG: DUF3999 domain-containing protein [Rhodanobacteraceae bacterium]|nr:DUF3999 domain-containing protein [Rhodanobacteraceae bacterium]